MEKDRCDEAKDSLIWLRGTTEVSEELDEIIEKKRAKDEQAATNGRSGISGTITSGRFLRPFVKISFLMCLTEWAGMNVIAQYMVIIFKESGSVIGPTVAPMIVAGMRVVLACVSTFIMRYSPRKPLFLICCVLIFISYTALGGYNFYKSQLLTRVEEDSVKYLTFLSHFGWIPLVALMTVQASQTIGFLSVIHFNLQAESFPTDIRSVACGLVGVVTALSRFVTTKLFPKFLEWFGFHGVFWFYAMFIIIIFCYALKIMPENKGKSLVQTEANFEKK